jgi:hypothetical protein
MLADARRLPPPIVIVAAEGEAREAPVLETLGQNYGHLRKSPPAGFFRLTALAMLLRRQQAILSVFRRLTAAYELPRDQKRAIQAASQAQQHASKPNILLIRSKPRTHNLVVSQFDCVGFDCERAAT